MPTQVIDRLQGIQLPATWQPASNPSRGAASTT